MFIKKIIVVTDNHYFSKGMLTLISEQESVNCTVMTAAQTNQLYDEINRIDENTLCIVDINNYFYNLVVYFDIISVLVDAKINLGNRLHILLCNNTAICLPLPACYYFVSLVITGRGVNAMQRTVRTLLESCPATSLIVKGGNTRAISALTPVENGVLTALFREQTVNEVAAKYQISPKCVSRHKCSGLKKLQKKRLYGI
ncbi:hypothetical protein ACG99R_004773 [Klebsiella aerogenes]